MTSSRSTANTIPEMDLKLSEVTSFLISLRMPTCRGAVDLSLFVLHDMSHESFSSVFLMISLLVVP